FVNGSWCSGPNSVKDVFKCHFETRFKNHVMIVLNLTLPLINGELSDIDKDLERGNASDSVLLKRMELMSQLNDINQLEAKNSAQKSKIQWAIEGDENSKFFHGIINKKRSILSICGVFVNGSWCSGPNSVKDVFKCHFETRFKKPCNDRLKLNSSFNKWLSPGQLKDLDRFISRDEIRKAIWSCGDNKSPGPDGFTFEFFRKYWHIVGSDFCAAVEHFFDTGVLPEGCNSSFISLIPKVPDAKFVTDFRPICLIGCVYKVITNVLAIRLATVISDLVSETQAAFVANRQILDGPFILNEVLNWCKRKRKQALFFKVDFAKAYDSVRWILGSLGFAKASILVNGSPTSEFPFYCGLKQGDHLAAFLFILIMESLHISFTRVVKDGLFKGIQLLGSVSISHLFYDDDVMFIGEWSDSNLRSIIHILKCFSLALGLNINIQKSQVLGVGVPHSLVEQAADMIGCPVLSRKFCYLGVMVGESMSRKAAWVDTLHKVQSRLSKWKVKTLSIGGRLTLIKSALGASPLYNMSIFKVPKGVLKTLEAIRSNFFNGSDSFDRKITWVAWDKVLASKRNGGLGVSSLYALNRALLLKWVWQFISMDGSLWFKVILAMNGPSRRGVVLDSTLCPQCSSDEENIHHVLFQCEIAKSVMRKICRWWDLAWQELSSFADWQVRHVPGATQEDLFGHDARPRLAGKPRPAKKTKSDATASTGGSNASTQFGHRMKREAAERAFEAQAEKDRTLMRLEELRFLATSTKDLDDVDAYWIKKQKRLIRNKIKNDLSAEDDEDEDE
nr:RNA-directed DNA polymerase, eukaryota [Tanacetum cinerariifolium]